MESKKIESHTKETLAHLKSFMGGKKMDAGEMLFATTKLMETVKDYQDLSGREKKKLVETTIKLYIKENNKDDEESVLLNIIFEKVVPGAIDLLVEVAKGKHKFKHVKKMFPCF